MQRLRLEVVNFFKIANFGFHWHARDSLVNVSLRCEHHLSETIRCWKSLLVVSEFVSEPAQICTIQRVEGKELVMREIGATNMATTSSPSPSELGPEGNENQAFEFGESPLLPMETTREQQVSRQEQSQRQLTIDHHHRHHHQGQEEEEEFVLAKGETRRQELTGSNQQLTLLSALDERNSSETQQQEAYETAESSKKGMMVAEFPPYEGAKGETIMMTDRSQTVSTKTADDSSQAASSSGISDPTSSSPDAGSTTTDEHFSITWHKLDYVVGSKWYKLAEQRKPILNGLSGSFRSGELSAILGPSGAGKSTLIDCLVGKRERGLRGRTQVVFSHSANEEERRKRRPLRIATIPQEDHLLDSLTVTETFMFASKIKNAHVKWEEELEDGSLDSDKFTSETDGKRKKRVAFNHFANVQRVIQQLHLTSCASLRCGKLSGGQYKRVSIGQELLSRPDLMILDEPTSGLDSVTCFQTISALRNLIENSPYPMAIVATIHQPDVEVFQLFHKAYVLASGGRAIYEGATDSIPDVVRLGLEQVQWRRKTMPLSTSATAKLTAPNLLGAKQQTLVSSAAERQLEQLMAQLDESSGRTCNPARLIVEIAAGEYGNEIMNALNDIQNKEHLDYLKSWDGQTRSTMQRMDSSITMDSPVASMSRSQMSGSQVPLDVPAAVARGPPAFDYAANDPALRKPELDKLLSLVSANMKQRRSVSVYFQHVLYHTHRSWITIVRDPMLFSVQVLLHIFVPLLISYSFQGHRGDACPRVGQLDVIEEAYREGTILDDLNHELRIVFENLGYMFFQIYVIIFAAVCMTSLTYPLVMHVLLKEYRNGWYSMSSYFLGRTFADLPVPTFNVVLALAISYHLTGQPMSPWAWRFASVAALTVLATLVAQTWGLMFGALLMNAPQAAVFVAPASTAPLVVVSGFLIRIQSLPGPLQILSQLSYFTHLLNGFVISRYGFNRCPCEEEDFLSENSHQVPQQARTMIDIWVESFGSEYPGYKNITSNSTGPPNLVDKLVSTISKAKTFGFEITNCSQVKPFTMLDYQLNDSDLLYCFAALIGMVLFFRWLTYMVLRWKIHSCL